MKKQFANLPRLVFLAVTLAPFIFWFVPLVTGQALYWGTPAMQFIPWRILGLEQVSQGVFPLWNPENGLGAPLLANYQTAFFYPPGWINDLFGRIFGNSGVAWGFTLLLALHGSFSGLGMAYLARKWNSNATGMIIAGLAYSLGSFFIARAGFFPMVWAGSWFPWMLFVVPADIFNSRFIWTPTRFPFASVLVLTMAFLAGHAQLCWYMLLFTTAWVMSLAWFQNRKLAVWKAVFGFLAAVAFAALLSAVQLIPTAELLVNSQRAGSVSFEDGLTYSYWPWRFITLFAPDFFGSPASGNYSGYGSFWEDAAYIGVIPVFLAISTLGQLFKKSSTDENRVKHKTILLLWIIIGVAFIFALGKNTPVFVFLYKYVPSFDMFNSPARFLIWAHMSLCILAAIGSSSWETPAGKGLYWLRLGTAGSASVVITSVVMMQLMPGLGQHFFRATTIFGILAFLAGTLTLTKGCFDRNRFGVYWRIVVLLVVMADLTIAGTGLNPEMPASEYGNGTTRNPYGDAEGRVFLDPASEYALKFQKYHRFNDYRPLGSAQEILDGTIPNTNIFTGTTYVNNFDPLLVAPFASLMELLPVMGEQEKDNWLRLMNVERTGNLDLTQTSGVKFIEIQGNSRLWWFPCSAAAASNEEALARSRELLQDWDGTTHLDTLVIEGIGAEKCQDAAPSAAVDFKISEETPVSIVIAVTTPQDGWVMLSDTWYPGWQSALDGEKAEIWRAFSLFRAVKVPAGEHVIEMTYKPLSFRLGLVISILGILFLIVLPGIKYLQRKKQDASSPLG